MMYRQLIILSVLINFLHAGEQNLSKHANENALTAEDDKYVNTGVFKSTSGSKLWKQHFWKPRKRSTHNMTYIDKAENMIRLPALNKYYEDRKLRRKTLKKSPRRTIQKIIKKNKNKLKKLYIIKMTSFPTVMPKVEYDNLPQEDLSMRKDETTTPPQKKRLRKYNPKLPRNPMPFHQMQGRKVKRDKRQTRDVFILKDLDEMKFLHQKKDYNVVNAHFKKYW
ncbi:hypothetical protein B5X24_HaOG213744 [Helicoverpa armigera]|uniref:Uncharacterized protein n=1 Tax=Helicoverpa armigera TaxID=29058 RepID=A0A2W1B6K5_HELAM|nr:hypothetical protein B5X24_HaOG213744 [Helicoverpa armigera]